MLDIELVKQHLRVLHSREDGVIKAYTRAAFAAFERFAERKLYKTIEDLELDQNAAPYAMAFSYSSVIDVDGNEETVTNHPDDILAGTLIYIGYLYTVRDMDAAIPRAVEALWQPYRIMRIA